MFHYRLEIVGRVLIVGNVKKFPRKLNFGKNDDSKMDEEHRQSVDCILVDDTGNDLKMVLFDDAVSKYSSNIEVW